MPESIVFVGHRVPVEEFRHFFQTDPCGWPTFDGFICCQLDDVIKKALANPSGVALTAGSDAGNESNTSVLVQWIVAEIGNETDPSQLEDEAVLGRIREAATAVLAGASPSIQLPFLFSHGGSIYGFERTLSQQALQQITDPTRARAPEESPPTTAADVDLRVFYAQSHAEMNDYCYVGIAVSETYDRVAVGGETVMSISDVEQRIQALSNYHQNHPNIHKTLGVSEAFTRSKIDCCSLLRTDVGESVSAKLIAGSRYAVESSDGGWTIPGLSSTGIEEKLPSEINAVLEAARGSSSEDVSAINQLKAAQTAGALPVLFVGSVVMNMHSHDTYNVESLDIDALKGAGHGTLFHIIEPEF